MPQKFHASFYQTIVESSLDAIIVINHRGHIVFWNDAAEKIFGYCAEEVMGKYVHDFLPPPDLRPPADHAFDQFKKTGAGAAIDQVVQLRGQCKDGRIIHVQFGLKRFEIEGERYAFAFIRDISELIELQEELAIQASRDPLTGLLNRRAYMQQIEPIFQHHLEQQQPLSLLLIDIDFFKQINDQYGHHAGDTALVELSTVIANEIEEGTIFSRIGGEEFVVVLPNCTIKQAREIAEHLRLRVEQTLIITEEVDFSCTVSIGLAAYQAGDANFEQLQSRADKALYQAKHISRNCVVADGVMEENVIADFV